MRRAKSVEELVEYQAAWHEVRVRLERIAGELRPESWAQGPWITVSRQFGSGGTELASKLAEALGWELLDKQIIAEMARREHTSTDAIARLDEHPARAFSDYLSYLLVPNAPSQARFLEQLKEIVRGRARRGRVVILGRGANWLLDPVWGLRLRVVAAEEDRVLLVMERDALGHAEARQRVEKMDSDQRAFVRQSFDRDIDDPLGYDLTINMSAMGSAVASEIVAAALQRKIAAVTA
jgi:cytidylate kinase